MLTSTEMIIVVSVILLAGILSGVVTAIIQNILRKRNKMENINFFDIVAPEKMSNSDVAVDDIIKDFVLLDLREAGEQHEKKHI